AITAGAFRLHRVTTTVLWGNRGILLRRSARLERQSGHGDRTKLTSEGCRVQALARAVPEERRELEHSLGGPEGTSPAYTGAVEAHADEVADGTLDSAGADVEILAAELGIAHAAAVFGEVRRGSTARPPTATRSPPIWTRSGS